MPIASSDQYYGSIAIRNRLFIRPLLSCPTTLIVPTSLVLATWVPPSACRSKPTMFTVRTSVIPFGKRLSKAIDLENATYFDFEDKEGILQFHFQ